MPGKQDQSLAVETNRKRKLKMADVLAPTQKLDGPAPVAGPALVDLSRLDAQKPAQANAEKQAAANPAPEGTALLASLSITDNSKAAAVPVKAAENVTTTPTTQPVDGTAPAAAKVADNVAPAPAAAQIADNQRAPAATDNCDKSTACTFTPTTDKEKSKPWWDARGQLVGTAPEKDANCLYKVQFGDDLSTIAQRQLHAEGKAVNAASLKAEEDKLVKLNDAQYKSLDCNRHYLQVGWKLQLTDNCATTPPAPVEAAPAPAPAPPARVEAPLPPPPPVEATLPPLPPLPPVDNCDRSYNGPVVDGGYRREDHMFQAPGHHIRLNFNNREYPFEVPPGKSIIYEDQGRQRMITECNEDGSRPRHSEIIYRIDHEGRRHGVSREEQQSYYQRFAPDYLQNYDGYSNNGAYPVQDRFSIEERRVNEERAIRDREMRRVETQRIEAERIEAERRAAERHNTLIQPQATNGTRATTEQSGARVAPGATIAQTPVQRIEALPTAAERTQARATEAEKIRTEQAAERQAKIQQQSQPAPVAAPARQPAAPGKQTGAPAAANRVYVP
jgi:hypothetical protein